MDTTNLWSGLNRLTTIFKSELLENNNNEQKMFLRPQYGNRCRIE